MQIPSLYYLLLSIFIHASQAIPHPTPTSSHQPDPSRSATLHDKAPGTSIRESLRYVTKALHSTSTPSSEYVDIDGPQCTGCVFEAIQPQQLAFPGHVSHLTQTVVDYTIVYPDGGTSSGTSTVPVTCCGCNEIVTDPADVTWTWEDATLTWPKTYLGYDYFQFATWGDGKAASTSVCSSKPTIITRGRAPLVYATTASPELYMAVPSPIVDKLQRDLNTSLPFDLHACTARPRGLTTCLEFPAAGELDGLPLSPPLVAAGAAAAAAAAAASFTTPVEQHTLVVGLVNETTTTHWWMSGTFTSDSAPSSTRAPSSRRSTKASLPGRTPAPTGSGSMVASNTTQTN